MIPFLLLNRWYPMTIEQQFNKYRSLLGLEEEPIELNILPVNGINEYEGSNLYWDENRGTWVIEFVNKHIYFLVQKEI